MARRAARSKKRTEKAASSKHTAKQDEDAWTVPDEAKWKTMAPYGLFAISDKDGVKHKFKRGDIATILPQHKSPGDTIEPHEYWVGKILEIRADAGSEDSTIIWTKVRWFYNAEDASAIAKDLDTSHIGKFERLSSLHWDFVLPHAFDEVISLPKLHTFPFLHNRKSKLKKKPSVGLGNAEEESNSFSAVSSTTDAGGGEEKDEDIELNEQVSIGPETFYWRYTIDVVGRKIHPKPGTKSCICFTPYSPDTTSSHKGIMFFCPRPTCRTFFHFGCLRDKQSVYIPDDKEVIYPSAFLSSGARRSRGRGRGKGNTSQSYRPLSGFKSKGDDTAVGISIALEDDDEVPWMTPRALHRLTTSPDAIDPIDLLSLLRPKPSTPPQIIYLLQRIYARQLAHYRHQDTPPQSHDAVSTTSAKSQYTPVKSRASTKLGGSLIEVEDMLVGENDDEMDDTETTTNCRGGSQRKEGTVWDPISRFSTLEFPKKMGSKQKQKQKVQIELSSHIEEDSLSTQPKGKPLTQTTLLATLFLLPSPFPPSYASIASSSAHPITTNASNIITASSSNVNVGFSTGSESNTLTDMRDLLLLASQPALRGARYFPRLGPSGNVNLVLAARQLVWDALSAVGSLDLSSATSHSRVSISTTKRSGKGKRGGGGGKKSSFGTRFEAQELDEAQLSHDIDPDTQDVEQWRRVTECLHGVLNDWKTKLLEGGKVLPPGREIDDGILIKNGLLLPLPDGHGEQDVTVDATDSEVQVVLNQELEIEVGNVLRSGRKRKQVPNDGDRARKKGRAERKDKDEEDEMLLRIDWACLSCGGLI